MALTAVKAISKRSEGSETESNVPFYGICRAYFCETFSIRKDVQLELLSSVLQ